LSQQLFQGLRYCFGEQLVGGGVIQELLLSIQGVLSATSR